MKSRSLFVIAFLCLAVGLAPRAAAQATIHVTTSAPGNSSGGCSLQEAIYAANFDQAIAIDTINPDHFYETGCEPGNGTDSIVLPASAVFQMTTIVDDAHNQYGPTATPIIFTNIIIEANGSRLELVPGSPNMRAFSVGFASSILTPGGTVAGGIGNLTIRNVHIKGFNVKGGDGATGGGGGLGAGGAIYVHGGGLTVENSTFEGNGAVGGNGSANSGIQGGGGGGLSGNGGSAGGTSPDVGPDFGGGGGGGGSRGNGGNGGASNYQGGFGGGGGGTVTRGFSPDMDTFSDGGFDCGGGGGRNSASGGNASGLDIADGSAGYCPGGGGGGGQSQTSYAAGEFVVGRGGDGAYGGGGGGGGGTGSGGTDGGNGGFGGGGGSGSTVETNVLGGPNGGNGGYGGGGGASILGAFSGGEPGGGGGGPFVGTSGNGDTHYGGGAAGGAIFNHSGTVVIRNSTFYGNYVYRGNSGGGRADNGADAGGAIFSLYGSLTVLNSTISNNTSSGTYAGIFVDNEKEYGGSGPLPTTSFILNNTIVANNGQRECGFNGPVTYSGVDNLIVNDYGCTGLAIIPSPDPQLGPLQINAPGSTPTMAIQPSSPAVDVADAGTSLSTDQRGVSRPQGLGFDVGAFEAGPPAADLSLSKSVSSNTAQIGDTLTYTLTLSNLGPQSANYVVVTDNLPSAVTFVSCSATGGGVCGASGNSVSISYTTLAASTTVSITLQATLNAGVPDATVVVNTASVAASSPNDPVSTNNTGSASFTVHNRADLVVEKQDWPLQVDVGDPVIYTIRLTNKGPYAAKSVVLTDIQPNQVTFNSCTSTVGTCNLSGGVASLNLASFASGASAFITVRATLNFGVANGAIVTNTATVTASTFDPNTSNNSDKAWFAVQNKSDLFATKTAYLTSVKSAWNIIYTVTVWNRGPYKAKAVVLSDPLPSNSTFVSLKTFGVSCTTPAVGQVGTITCNVGNLPTGAWSTVTITVNVPGSANKTSITNTATASAATFDPKTANNSASVTTQINGTKK